MSRAFRLGMLMLLAAAAARADEAAPFGPPVDDQRWYLHGLFDELEGRLGANSAAHWQGSVWLGDEDHKLWLQSEGELEHGVVQDGQQQLLYAQAFSPYFDWQAGVRYDLDTDAGRGWAAFGVQGLTPYEIALAATGYIGDAGRLAARLELSHDSQLTQRLILQPQLELNAYAHPDPARQRPAGLADIDAGLRLRYEISRKLAPYLGFAYQRRDGHVEGAGWHAVLGLRTWF